MDGTGASSASDPGPGRTNPPLARAAAPGLPMRVDSRLLAVSAAGFCVFLSVYATQALLPLLASVFHATAVHASLTVTATTLAIALAAPAEGILAEWIGRKTIIVGSIFVLTVPTLLAATANSLNALIGWRFAQGLCMPGTIAVILAYICEEWPAGQVGTAMSAYVSGSVLGGVTGRLMSGWIAGQYGWNWAFVALGLLDLIGAIVISRGLPRSTHPHHQPRLNAALRGMARHLKNGRLLSSYAVAFNILLALVATFTYVMFHLAAPPYRLGPEGLGLLFLVYLLGVVVTPIGGRFLDRHGHRNGLLCALAISAAGIALTLAPSLIAIIIGLALLSSGIFICQSAAASYMGRVAGDARASASGLYATFYYIGGAAGAFVPGLFWKLGGWPATVGFILAVLVLTFCIALLTWIPGPADSTATTLSW